MATCNSWLWQVLNLHIAWICMDLWDKRRNTHRKLNESASVPTCISIQTVPPWICSISSHSSHMSETRGEPQDVPGLNIRPMPILPSLSWFPCTWQLHRHWLHVIFTLLHVMDHQCSKSDEEIPSISIPKRPRPGIPQCSLPRFYPLELEVPSNSWPVGLLLDSCSQKGSQKGSLSQASCMGDHLFRPTRPSGSLLSFYQLSVSNTWSHS